MNLKQVTIRRLNMALKAPFTTSFGTFTDREFLIIEVRDGDGKVGYGESVAFASPWYNEETVDTNVHMIEKFLVPALQEKPITHPEEVSERFAFIRRNNMAKSAVEGAIWDLYAKQQNKPLAEVLGGVAKQIDVGVSIGIKDSVEDLIETVQSHVDAGYKRIKIKIKPGWDIDVLREVRKQFPTIQMMGDANSAYTLEDLDHLKQLDELNLTMVEQPLEHDDIIDHRLLQEAMTTPICLDESIHSLADAKKAIALGSCKIINIKIGRVGGLTEAKRIHDYCKEQDIPVWCGGCLESGIGRAHNIALTTLPQFILPGDTASSANYWHKDIISPEVVAENGVIQVPTGAGIGYDINEEALEEFTVNCSTIELD
ncbi:LOW QUALITY PROTEIN: O-succinylbenzoate synthase [Geomicrobium sp. JCM 19055]|nr:LOW QUALITY PROTEIN: O-succinylbenzoate synthase [Geomicrobium sp. JCM 19055]